MRDSRFERERVERNSERFGNEERGSRPVSLGRGAILSV